MNAMLVLVFAAICLVCGYIFYGSWLAKQWGVDASNPVPAQELADGVDYVEAKPYVLLGHHFSSIAGAGPINGPIQAAIFGWVPVLLWVIIGGIFFGAVHDFGALFASIRHKGKSIGIVIADNIDNTAKTLFCVFAYLTLVLVVAAFASIVANTFVSTADAANIANQRTAMISILFILIAVVYGLATRGKEIPTAVNIVACIAIIIVIIAVGYNFHPIQLSYTTWMLILGVYIFIASIAPVWILLQPRDFLSSFLLYAMIIMSFIGIVGATIMGAASNLEIPAFTGFIASNAAIDISTGEAIVDELGNALTNSAAASGYIFPVLFVTIACGAISGFHSMVSSGTTAKQLSNEKYAQPIGYGGMLIECLLATISLCAVAFVYAGYRAGDYSAPTAVFAGGLSKMLATIPGLAGVEELAYALLILAVSAFCLTSLDTATRLARFTFQELFTPADGSEPTGVRSVLTNIYVATAITVVVGIWLGMTGYSIIWPLFGAANQLLAALALLAVAAWLGNAGRNNKMLILPMVFMLCVTLTSLYFTMQAKLALIQAGGDIFAPAVQFGIAIVLFVLAIVLAVKGAKTLFGKKAA